MGCVVMMMGCSGPETKSTDPVHGSAPAPHVWGNTVTVPGGAAAGDVLVLDDRGAVIAQAPIAHERYEIVPAPTGRRVMARLEGPIVGIHEIPITSTTAPAIAVAAGDVATLRGTIELPAGASFDWVDLEITPAGPPGTTVLWADARGSLRAAMTTRRLETPAVAIEMIKGTYRINVSRVVDGPKGSAAASFALDHIQRGTESIAAPTLAGATLELAGAAEVRFVLRPLRDNER